MSSYSDPWVAGTSYKPGAFVGVAAMRQKTRVPKLFEPLTQRGVTFKNRIVVSPLCQYSSKAGFFNDWHLCHLGNFARGGAGLVIFEATAVQPNGRITPYCTGLWEDAQIASASRVVDFVQKMGARAGLQLAHAGRKASAAPPLLSFDPRRGQEVGEAEGGWPASVVGPDSQKFSSASAQPAALSTSELAEIVAAFAAAAHRADKAGFDMVEIHGAHGYLISSFNSALSNTRTDEYGGSFENRTRLALEVAVAVRAAFPAHKPVWFRVSCSDQVDTPGSWDLAQTIALAKRLQEVGVDLLDCSSSGNLAHAKVGPSNGVSPGYQVPFARAVKAEAKIPVGAVGVITAPAQAEQILNNDNVDVILVGREFMRDPFWGLRAARALGVDLHWTQQYDWAVNLPPKL